MTDVSAAGVAPGDVLAGKYRVERVLGVGGMGVVVAAHHVQLDEKVALKFLTGTAVSDAAACARFAREARMAVKIKNEHVARVSDVGELENGSPYMVMEYLEGEDLAAWIHGRGRLPIEQATDFVLQACVAVADAHALGIVHRDLKPANLFCVRRSDGQLTIKVLDFGISKLTDASGVAAAMTKTSTVMGTPLYMAPEQMRSSKAVDARADIWSLGVILYELVTGDSPFPADSVMELALKVADDPPRSLRTALPEAPEAFERVLLKCLEKRPEQRFANVGELALALKPFAPDRSKASIDRISGIVASAGLTTTGPHPELPGEIASAPTLALPSQTAAGVSLGTQPPRDPKRRPVPAIVGVVALGGVLALGLFLGGGFRGGQKPEGPHVPVKGSATTETSAAPVATPEPSQGARSPVAAPPPATTAGAPPAAPTSPASAAAAVASTVRATSARTASFPPPSTAGARPAAKPAPPAGKSNCDPNFTYDADGNKIFKPECFGR